MTTVVLYNIRHGKIIKDMPALPPGTLTLAPGRAGGWDALAVHTTKLAVWRLPRGGATWAAAQTITAPIEFGSPG